MAAAPVGMFLMVLGLFTLVELRAGRVVDPEDVPARLRLSVLGVVPPLPRPRPASGHRSRREELRSGRDLDRFIQSLDHLRVAICSGRDARGRPRRSILITSACGSEGKTTLAAQLAERCVNAGLLTLLIDADLRNPTLSRMFDLPERPGPGRRPEGRGDGRGGDRRHRRGRRVPLPAGRVGAGRPQPAAPRRAPRPGSWPGPARASTW